MTTLGEHDNSSEDVGYSDILFRLSSISGDFETWEMRNRYPWIFKDGICRRIEEITGIPCSFGASSNGRVYLKVPFSEKDEAKSLGAKWDVEKKLWYIYGNLTESPAFSKWRISEDVTAMLNNAEHRSR